MQQYPPNAFIAQEKLFLDWTFENERFLWYKKLKLSSSMKKKVSEIQQTLNFQQRPWWKELLIKLLKRELQEKYILRVS